MLCTLFCAESLGFKQWCMAVTEYLYVDASLFQPYSKIQCIANVYSENAYPVEQVKFKIIRLVMAFRTYVRVQVGGWVRVEFKIICLVMVFK